MADVTLEVTSTQINTGVKKINAINGTASEINAKLDKADSALQVIPMPSVNTIKYTITDDTLSFTADYAGWVFAMGTSGSVNQRAYIITRNQSNNETLLTTNMYNSASGQHFRLICPVGKGQLVEVGIPTSATNRAVKLVVAEGQM